MRNKIVSFIIVLIAAMLLSCDGEPLFTDLINSNLYVVLKGTYESNNPNNINLVGISATKFMLDVAEIRMNGDKFANYRQTYSVSLSDSESFFNGTGVSFKSDDVKTGKNYNQVNIYFRKMLFDGCNNTEVFAEEDVTGFDFNKYQILSQADYDSSNFAVNYIFPKSVNLSNTFVYDNDNEYVLEIRLFVKNNIKEYTGMNADLPDPFYAFEDTIVPTSAGDKYIGGNVRVGVHIYEIGKTATIRTGTASTGSNWICAVPSGQDPLEYTVPPIVTSCSGAGNYELQNVPVGMTWDIYSSSNDPSTTAPSAMGWASVGSVTLNESQAGTVVAGP